MWPRSSKRNRAVRIGRSGRSSTKLFGAASKGVSRRGQNGNSRSSRATSEGCSQVFRSTTSESSWKRSKVRSTGDSGRRESPAVRLPSAFGAAPAEPRLAGASSGGTGGLSPRVDNDLGVPENQHDRQSLRASAFRERGRLGRVLMA